MNVLKNCNIVLAQKQPKNLLHLLSRARFNPDTNNLIQPKLLFYMYRYTLQILEKRLE